MTSAYVPATEQLVVEGVLAPISDRYYGLRDFTVADPDGFGIRFGTRILGS